MNRKIKLVDNSFEYTIAQLKEAMTQDSYFTIELIGGPDIQGQPNGKYSQNRDFLSLPLRTCVGPRVLKISLENGVIQI